MHEISLTRALIIHVLRVVEPMQAEKIHQVTVSVGPLAGVDSMLVRIAFEQLKSVYLMSNSSLVVQDSQLQAECRVCEAVTDIGDFNFRCAQCGSAQLRITQGDDFRLLSVEVREEQSC